MGQQQLLLIVLGVIIVGIAVVVGINLFNANAEESAKDTIVSECTNIAALALQHYKKPLALGGGGNLFTTFTIPPALVTTNSGTYGAVPNTSVDCVITGTPLTTTGYTWKVRITVTGAGIYSTVFI